MLDVARHFFEIPDVKKYIDHIAFYKLNKLHLHLSDDQGWRIEIKSWPNLTEHGGKLEVGGTEGGYYTQEDYVELVEYAAKKHITIVPEIDMPGHTNAALASYAELNCNNEAPALYTGFEVGFSSLCTEKNITYEFVDDVIKELSALTPGPYMHIGGDESLVTPKEDYITFIETIQQTTLSYGKTLIGWEEVAQANLMSGSVMQLWKESDYIETTTTEDYSVIMSQAEFTYLDMKYHAGTALGLSWAGYISVEKGYKWEPTTSIDDSIADKIIGLEAPLWTVTITNIDELEYMAFPRILGYAETAWSEPENKNWAEYRYRLAKQQRYFKLADIDFYHSELIPWDD